MRMPIAFRRLLAVILMPLLFIACHYSGGDHDKKASDHDSTAVAHDTTAGFDTIYTGPVKAPGDYDTIFNNPMRYCNMVHQLNTVVMGNNFGPIVASRNYMYAAVAGYEVIAAGYPDQYVSLAGQLHGLKYVPKPVLAGLSNSVWQRCWPFCKLGEAVTFPEGSMKDYVDSLKRLAKQHGMSREMYRNTIAYADSVALAIMKWSKHDNYLETRGAPEYMVKDSPGRWVPTPPAYASAMEPHWSTIGTW